MVVARRQDRLEELALELEPMVAVDVLVADLSDRDDVDRVARRVASDHEPIDLLVNNAGIGTAGAFVDSSIGRDLDAVGVNVTAVVALSHAAARRMTTMQRGTIVNVSSTAGNQPRSGSAVYGATKAFVTSFSQALASELDGTGVSCTAVLPGLTHTEFHEVSDITDQSPRVMWMTAEAVVESALGGGGGGSASGDPGRDQQSGQRLCHASTRAVARPGDARRRGDREAAVALDSPL